jgi:hypothetical protein
MPDAKTRLLTSPIPGKIIGALQFQGTMKIRPNQDVIIIGLDVENTSVYMVDIPGQGETRLLRSLVKPVSPEHDDLLRDVLKEIQEEKQQRINGLVRA